MVTIGPSALNGRYLAQIAAVIFSGPAGRVVRGRTQWCRFLRLPEALCLTDSQKPLTLPAA